MAWLDTTRAGRASRAARGIAFAAVRISGTDDDDDDAAKCGLGVLIRLEAFECNVSTSRNDWFVGRNETTELSEA